MLKLFGYECRRLLCGKAFLWLALVTLWYARQTLRGEIIWGVSDTAPFSPWSFGYYLAVLLPFLTAAGLLLLAGFYTKPARAASALTQATPFSPRKYALARCGAVALGLGLLCLCVAAMGIFFFLRLFGIVPMRGFGQVAILTLLPLPVLALGLGTVLGRRGTVPVYGLAALSLLTPLLPAAWEPTGATFFSSFPAALGVLDPPLQIPAAQWALRAGMVLVGLLLLGIGARRNAPPKK